MFNLCDVNKIPQDGYVPVPYTFIREFGVFVTCVLFQIVSELRYADKNCLQIDNCFLTDLKRMADYLGITVPQLKESLNTLKDYELIDWYESDIAETAQIFVNVDNIVRLKKKLDEKQGFLKWDTGLKSAQNPNWKKRNFTESTNAIIDYVEKHFTKDIPMIVYQLCNDFVTDYESDGANLLDDVPDIANFINKNMRSENYGTSLYCIVDYLCNN